MLHPTASRPQTTILTVDDDPTNQMVIDKILTRAGYHVVKAFSGDEAIARAPLVKPDLILLDVMMPGRDGFDTCNALRALSDIQDVPILFATALENNDSKMRAFESGAVDYITKPYYRPELLARIRIHLRFRASYKALLNEHMKQMQSLIEAQSVLMPTPENIPNSRYEAYYLPQHHAGGDFYDVIPVYPGVIDYIVADVSGHDVGCSLPTAALRALLRQNAALAFSPPESLYLVNEHLRSILQPGQYITLTHLRLDRNVNVATLTNAGHPPVYHLADTLQRRTLKSCPVGCFDSFTPPDMEFEFRTGDRFVLYSDSFIEENDGNPIQRAEGARNLEQAILDTAKCDPKDAVTQIAEKLHPRPQRALDDLLLICIDA